MMNNKIEDILKKIVKDDKLRYSPEELLNRIVSFHSDFWTHITKNYNLPDEFLIQFQNYIDWNAFIEKHFPNIELIENIASIKFWEKISIYQNLDKNFIDKYKEKLNWSSISKYQILDSDDLNKYKNDFKEKRHLIDRRTNFIYFVIISLKQKFMLDLVIEKKDFDSENIFDFKYRISNNNLNDIDKYNWNISKINNLKP